MSDVEISKDFLWLTKKIKQIEKDESFRSEDLFVSASSKLIESAASIYEKVRSTIDYKEEHVLRRQAIERIINRRIRLNQKSDKVIKGMITELIQSGYIEKNSVTKHQVKLILDSFRKFQCCVSKTSKEDSSFFLSIASADIESILVSNEKENALIDVMVKIILNDLPDNIKSKINLITLYLVANKIFLKVDKATQYHFIFKKIFPAWNDINKQFLGSILTKQKILKTKKKILDVVQYQENTQVNKIIKRYNPIFIVLQKIVSQNPKNLKKIFSDSSSLKNHIEMIIEQHNSMLKKQLSSSAIRAMLFILITKLILALIVEVPFDLYFIGHIDWLVLAINLIFPPALIFMIVSMISIPGEKNTIELVSQIERLVYFNNKKNTLLKRSAIEKTTKRYLTIIYSLILLTIISLVVWVLKILGFNIISGFLFFFFVSVVSFLAFRIRMSAKELEIVKPKENFATDLLDFILMPFLYIGRSLAKNFEGVNVFLMILDLIIEAPFKIMLELVGHWMDFLREKKEEIIG